MQTNIVARHMEMTEPIQAYAREKMDRLPRFFDRVQKVDVIIEKLDNHTFEVELVVHVDGHEHFIAKNRHDDLYACIDGVSDKMERQLHDHKEKLQARHR